MVSRAGFEPATPGLKVFGGGFRTDSVVFVSILYSRNIEDYVLDTFRISPLIFTRM